MPFTILLTADRNVPFDLDSIVRSLNAISKEVNYITAEGANLEEGFLNFPETHVGYKELLQTFDTKFHLAIHYTILPYIDNYFYHNYESKYQIVSMYGWNDLTNLPHENGAFAFAADALRDYIDGDFRHFDNTGCLYDFLSVKSGIDACLRNASICPDCLGRIGALSLSPKKKRMMEDLKSMCNALGSASKWNQNVIDHIKSLRITIAKMAKPTTLQQRCKLKKDGVIQILVASPGDAFSEREILFNKLERKFREEGHEDILCRIIVTGWESVASQPGYPQDIINFELVSKSDIVLAVFKHKLGTPTINLENGTKRAESGTVEELYYALNNNNINNAPLPMAYFCSIPPVMSFDVVDLDKNIEEWKRLKAFKEGLNNKIIRKVYASPEDLLNVVCSDLRQNIGNHFEIKKAKKRAK